MEMTNGSCIVALCHFCEHHGPSSVFHTRLKDDNPTRKLISSSNSNCTACNPLGQDHPGFSSFEPNMNVHTISSNSCATDKIQSRLHQACFRSLSSEVSPSKEGPIFFSDSGIGIHVISHTFFLKDSSARGFQRWFSLIVLASESAPLLKLYNPLVVEIKEVIGDLQQMAAEVYQREEEHCSHRMLRSHLHITNVGAARSLQEITGNQTILLKLHVKLSRIVLLTNNESANQKKSRAYISSNPELPFDKEKILTLVHICQELGSLNFKRFVRHIMKGGLTSVSTDDLFFKESCINALQLLVPIQNAKSFIISQHTLKNVTHPYLLVSSKGQKITCIMNDCETYSKASCIVARLENILMTEDVSSSFLHKQITSIREEVQQAARKMRELANVDQNKLLQFFQSFGYDGGDVDILHHWSLLYCSNPAVDESGSLR